MNFTAKSLVAGLFLIAGAAMAADATDPDVIARQDVMKTVGANTKILGEMAGGKTTFDAAKAAEARAAIIDASTQIEAKFTPHATDPASEAKPEIWTNWDDFLKHATTLNEAATALDPASVETIGAGMGPLGNACKDCHTDYRIKT